MFLESNIREDGSAAYLHGLTNLLDVLGLGMFGVRVQSGGAHFFVTQFGLLEPLPLSIHPVKLLLPFIHIRCVETGSHVGSLEPLGLTLLVGSEVGDPREVEVGDLTQAGVRGLTFAGS